MKKSLSKLDFIKKDPLPIIIQNEVAECGLACLAMISSYHRRKIELVTLRSRFSVSSRGMTLEKLIQVANNIGFKPRPLRIELEHLSQLQLPVIAHWDMNHFVVIKSVSKRSVTIHDPAIGKKVYSMDEISKHLTGVILELHPAEDFKPKKQKKPVNLNLKIYGLQLVDLRKLYSKHLFYHSSCRYLFCSVHFIFN